ncbi:hypothetical protein [Kitasatospora camelliae]|uniref:Uncharacterized protein n=1 Tax=Kitasatospora camelliae TaxID=3156397 RepID=A0AAU8JQL1_9ACTN
MDDLRERLKAAAESHRPDRARMLARVERGMAGGPAGRSDGRGGRGGRGDCNGRDGWRAARSGPLSWPRVVLATLATAGVLVGGGLAVAGIVQGPGAAASRPGTQTGPAATGSPTAGGSPAAGGGKQSGGNRIADGPLWSDGSVDPHSTAYWAQSNLTLKTGEQLTALTVELRIALTGGVQDTGHWQTRAAEDFDTTVREESGFLVYRWTLRPGRTVPPGEHMFAGQYNHAAGGRDAKDDTYRMDTGSAAVWGDFAPTR